MECDSPISVDINQSSNIKVDLLSFYIYQTIKKSSTVVTALADHTCENNNSSRWILRSSLNGRSVIHAVCACLLKNSVGYCEWTGHFPGLFIKRLTKSVFRL